MLFGSFGMRILVDHEPLIEFNQRMEYSSVTTGQSFYYSVSETQTKLCPRNCFVVIPQPGTKFTVEFHASEATEEEPIMAFLYVDGLNDFTHMAITDNKPKIKEWFWNELRDEKYSFQFGPYLPPPIPPRNQNDPYPTRRISKYRNRHAYLRNSRYIPNENTQGGLGAISVYFYRAKRVSRDVDIPKFDLRTTQIPEDLSINKGIQIPIGFNPSTPESQEPVPRFCQLEAIENHAIAALHIHYRSSEWLIKNKIMTDPKGKQAALFPTPTPTPSQPSLRISLKKPIPSTKKVASNINDSQVTLITNNPESLSITNNYEAIPILNNSQATTTSNPQVSPIRITRRNSKNLTNTMTPTDFKANLNTNNSNIVPNTHSPKVGPAMNNSKVGPTFNHSNSSPSTKKPSLSIRFGGQSKTQAKSPSKTDLLNIIPIDFTEENLGIGPSRPTRSRGIRSTTIVNNNYEQVPQQTMSFPIHTSHSNSDGKQPRVTFKTSTIKESSSNETKIRKKKGAHIGEDDEYHNGDDEEDDEKDGDYEEDGKYDEEEEDDEYKIEEEEEDDDEEELFIKKFQKKRKNTSRKTKARFYDDDDDDDY